MSKPNHGRESRWVSWTYFPDKGEDSLDAHISEVHVSCVCGHKVSGKVTPDETGDYDAGAAEAEAKMAEHLKEHAA